MNMLRTTLLGVGTSLLCLEFGLSLEGAIGALLVVGCLIDAIRERE